VSPGDRRSLDATLSGVDLRQARALKIRDLLRRHREEVEADPNGAPIVRGELVLVAPSPELLVAARAAGFTIVREGHYDALEFSLVVLRAPSGTSTTRAREEIRALDPQARFDFNHLYLESAAATEQGRQADAPVAPDPPDPPDAHRVATRVGLIDGGIAIGHAAFREATIHSSGCDHNVPSAHGTAVASLLVGHEGAFAGAAAAGELYAVDVYCGQAAGGSATAIAAALNTLVGFRVAVVNVSLVGPPNVLLATAVAAAIARGHLIVAAIGNDGPAAPPLYPASYPDVIAVTAVDPRDRLLPEAGRGPTVVFAAPGSELAAAVPPDAYGAVRGTSFASPIVAGLLAFMVTTPDAVAAAGAVNALAAKAKKVSGSAGDALGRGVVGDALRVDPARLKGRRSSTG
jgi:Subtilase family